MKNDNNTKICRKCYEKMRKGAVICPNCNSLQRIPFWVIMLIIVGIIVIYILSLFIRTLISFNDVMDSNKYSGNKSYNSTNNTTYPHYKIYGFNEKFVFDNLEITIGSNYSFDIVRNEFSDYNNQFVVKLPITVKNISTETHGLNMFYYDIYGTKGTEVKKLGAYFDDDIDFAGDLRSGASYTKYIYFQYDGNGNYAIEFDNYSSKINAEFNITK